jgi:hypothetical protein
VQVVSVQTGAPLVMEDTTIVAHGRVAASRHNNSQDCGGWQGGIGYNRAQFVPAERNNR